MELKEEGCSIEKIFEEIPGYEDPIKSLLSLIEDNGISIYRISKECGLNPASIPTTVESSISHEVAMRLAKFFELDPVYFALLNSYKKIMAKYEVLDLKDIGTYRDWVNIISSHDECPECAYDFTSYHIGETPKYGDAFEVNCPFCKKTIKALQSKLKKEKTIPKKGARVKKIVEGDWE